MISLLLGAMERLFGFLYKLWKKKKSMWRSLDESQKKRCTESRIQKSFTISIFCSIQALYILARAKLYCHDSSTTAGLYRMWTNCQILFGHLKTHIKTLYQDTVKKARWVKGERRSYQTPAKGLETRHRNKQSVLKPIKIGSKTRP